MLTCDFRRKLLALSVRSDVVFRYRHLFRKELFLEQSGVVGPQAIIAGFIEECFKRGSRPDIATIEYIIASNQGKFSPEFLEAIKKEWSEIGRVDTSDAAVLIDTLVDKLLELEIRARVSKVSEAIKRYDTSGGDLDVRGIANFLSGLSDISVEAPTGRFWIDPELPPEIHWQKNTKVRVQCGLDPLDNALFGGFPKGEFYIFLAPPKGGKSAILSTIAANCAFVGFKVAFFSYEMVLNDMLRRFDRSITSIPATEMNAHLGDLKLIYESIGSRGGNIWIEELRPMVHGPLDAQLRIRDLCNRGFVPDLVIMDYLNLMSLRGKRVEKRHEMAEIARIMSAMAKEFNVALLSACLVRRDAVRKKMVTKVDIAESFEVIAVVDGAIAIAADDVMIENNMRSLYIAAMRDAPDERYAGTYIVDFARMSFLPVLDDDDQERNA
ncbi:MAG: DnaB-like helicase C-terminal domain-containing protein [Candidatus Methanomethylicaceae archaeon]